MFDEKPCAHRLGHLNKGLVFFKAKVFTWILATQAKYQSSYPDSSTFEQYCWLSMPFGSSTRDLLKEADACSGESALSTHLQMTCISQVKERHKSIKLNADKFKITAERRCQHGTFMLCAPLLCVLHLGSVR